MGIRGLALCAALFACGMSSASATMRIAGDRGGQIGQYLQNFAAVRSSGERVVIDGNCLSACTMVLGLIPDCDLDKVSAVGNAAGAGARMALLNRGYRREIEETVSRIEKIETALEPKFQEHFVYAMALPNKVDPFPKLSAAVKLPPRKTVSEDGVAGDAAPRRRSREGHAARRGRE